MLNYTEKYLTPDQEDWFGNRMSEGSTGTVAVPSYLYVKFKKIVGMPYLKNHEIKSYLIEHCY